MKRSSVIKKKYISAIDREKTLSELVAEDRIKESKETKKRPIDKTKRIKIISCANCEEFTLTEVRDGKTYGIFNCKGHCTHMDGH